MHAQNELILNLMPATGLKYLGKLFILMETEIHFLLGYFKSQHDSGATQLNLLMNQSVISIVLPSSVLMRSHTMSQRIYIFPRLA